MLLRNCYGNDLPKPVQLIEIGPGRGTLMNDVLKVKNKEVRIIS
jgi:SAM-dependent MidA family methyltransferase